MWKRQAAFLKQRRSRSNCVRATSAKEKGVRSIAATVLFSLSLGGVAVGRPPAIPRHDSIPDAFQPILEAPGVTLFQHGSDYVQAIDLSRGASVSFEFGPVVERRSGLGAYGGDDPEFERQSLETAWTTLRDRDPAAFCIANGQFFRNDRNRATALAFPVKAGGEFVSNGYAGESEFADEKLILEVWPDRAAIVAFDPLEWRQNDAPEAIVGLTPTAEKSSAIAVGRTFAGIKDKDRDGTAETVLLLSSSKATQARAAEVLKEFGAIAVLMLDGGGSTQLLCRDRHYLDSPRTVPQTIAVTAASKQTRFFPRFRDGRSVLNPH